MVKVHQYEVYWISLDPSQGSEMAKNRPCIVISPDDLNEYLKTLIIAPITSTIKPYPWRVSCTVSGRQGSIATDQIRVVDKSRLGAKLGKLTKSEISLLKDSLYKMFND